MQLTWLGTAGFRVETDEGAIFLIDPFLSRPKEAKPASPIQLADLFPIDEIFLTNGRFDHALDTPAIVEQTGAIVHAPQAVKQRLAKQGVSAHSLQSVTLNEAKQLGSLSWQALAGQVSPADFSPGLLALMRDRANFLPVRDLDRDWPLGEIVTYLFQIETLTMIYFGSAGWDETAISGLEPDVALLPVERTPTQNGDVARLAALLKPKLIIPHHWDNYYPNLSKMVDLTDLAAIVRSQLPRAQVYQPVIGQPFDVVALLNSTG